MEYERETEGIRVRVRPSFSLARSRPADGQWVFTYHVDLVNEGDVAGQLLFRFWRIHDAIGEDTEVDGEGVLGEQPRLAPGERHGYQSFCILESPVGWMEGHYTFERPDGRQFRVSVPRFRLEAPLPPMQGFELLDDAEDGEADHLMN